VPIDKSEMDLVYANMIFKGELERNGAKFIKGTDSAGKQSLLFSFPDTAKQYEINIFYDNNLYRNKQKKRTITIIVDDFVQLAVICLPVFWLWIRRSAFPSFPKKNIACKQ